MPAGDKTGPNGAGPLTGRGLGKCSDTGNVQGRGNGATRGVGQGNGRGFARGPQDGRGLGNGQKVNINGRGRR